MGIMPYHSAKFPGRTGPKLEIPRNQPLVGIEFETELRGRSTLIDRVEKAFANKPVQFHPETDGSLSGDCGVEFVSSPMKATEALSNDGPLAELLSIIKDAEIRTDSSRIGMHVNVSARDDRHCWATAVFGNALASFGRRVGGRGDVYSQHAASFAQFKPNQESYGKGCAVAMRQRSIASVGWTCPTTGIQLPPLVAEREWRNEFRNCRSTTDFNLARVQVRYCVLVSQFAQASIDVLEGMPNGAAFSAEFVARTEQAFLRFVKSRTRGRDGITQKLYELLSDNKRALWNLAESYRDADWIKSRIKTNQVPVAA